MRKEIFVSDTATERRIAIQEDGALVEFYVEKSGEMGIVGNIYKGKVENVLPGMQAAFVDIGHEINAFLPFSEINNPEYLKEASTEEEDFEVDIDKLEFDFKTYGTNKHRLGDIVGSSSENETDELRERDSSYSKANIEQDFLNDAGSIKKS